MSVADWSQGVADNALHFDTVEEARTNAHKWFDVLWRKGPHRVCTRDKAYLMLRHHMGMTGQQCHIKLFDIEQCETVIAFAKRRLLLDKSI